VLANEHHLENLIAVDNTDATFVENYISLAENSFDLISSNKV
jgi:aspartokinase/homoserine dehydrogenase 1